MQKLKQSFSHNDVEIVEKKIMYQGYCRIEKYQLRHRLFNGGWGKILFRELTIRGTAVGVLLFDPILNKVVLIEQFRLGALEDKESPWLFELVAGMIDEGETPTTVAHRETQEEAGLMLTELLSICDYWTSPGASAEKISLFCGKVDASNAEGVYGLEEEGEDIRVVVLSLEEVFQALAAGQIKNAPAIIAIQWLQLNQDKVRQVWSA